MQRVVCEYDAREGYGYHVELREGNRIIEEYDAGDSACDSQVYGTYEVPESDLLAWAEQTAKELVQEHFPARDKKLRVYIGHNPDLLH